ncbi:uncharacterized protein V6R79_002282 [Siganus canaliculatus]
MDHDHAYTSTSFDKTTDSAFTYKMSSKEVEEFVKLRISNKYLFSGKRNTSMWAWRAILKHMGLQRKMTHYQASKKWENMRKKYKRLKNPPDGVQIYPESWPYFRLMDDAMEGRLEGNAPLLKTLPNDNDFLPFSRSKRRKIEMVSDARMSSLGGGPEIEVSLDGDDNGEEEGRQELDCIMQEVDQERSMIDGERMTIDREKQAMGRERLMLQRERAVLDRENAALERDWALLEREKAMIEREKSVLERERAMLQKERDAVRRERLALQREKARTEKTFVPSERTEEVTENGDEATDLDMRDRRERFLNLFEQLIENF